MVPVLATLVAAAAAADPSLVVHEWGTFTSVQGSDGVDLEGLHHEEERVPPFVHDRADTVPATRIRRPFFKGLEAPVVRVTQKMETPVLYLHTPRRQAVRVRVDHVDGLITQWYPAASDYGPPVSEADLLDVSSIGHSFVTWDVVATPRRHGKPPAVREREPWSLARDVDAAWVRTADRTETERYLFYRGLGSFVLPVAVTSEGGGTATLHNRSAEALPVAVALEVEGGGARFALLGDVPAGAGVEHTLHDTPFSPRREVVPGLKAILRDGLVAQGLCADEADAMVSTWSRQWFWTPGQRVIYLVPRTTTDALLPLQVEPAPVEIVRVLVGRIEVLTPEVEAEVADALLAWSDPDPEVRRAAGRQLQAYGRFLEPRVRRAMIVGDPEVYAAGSEVLALLGASGSAGGDGAAMRR